MRLGSSVRICSDGAFRPAKDSKYIETTSSILCFFDFKSVALEARVFLHRIAFILKGIRHSSTYSVKAAC